MVTVTFKNVTKSEALKEHIEAKLNEFFQEINEEHTEAMVVVRKEKRFFIIEITVHMKKQIFRVEQSGEDLYLLTNKSIDVLLGKYRKFKTKIDKTRKNKREQKYNELNSYNTKQEEPILDISKIKTIKPEKMTIEDAIENIELLGHSFYVFRDLDDMLKLLYKRDTEKYGENSYGVIVVEG